MLHVNACNFHKKFMYWKWVFALYLDIQVWYKIIESKRILRLLKSWWIMDFLIFLEWQPTEPRQGNWRLIAVGYEMSVSWHTYHRATYHRLYIIWNKKDIQISDIVTGWSATLSPSLNLDRDFETFWIVGRLGGQTD